MEKVFIQKEIEKEKKAKQEKVTIGPKSHFRTFHNQNTFL